MQLDFGKEEAKEWGLVDGCVAWLKKAVYGLKDAPALWYKAFVGAVVRLKGEVMPVEEGLVRWVAAGQAAAGVVVLHVDDCMFVGGGRFKKEFVEGLRKDFPFGDRELAVGQPEGVKYTGLRFFQDGEAVRMGQQGYVGSMQVVKEDPRRRPGQLLEDGEVEAYRSLLGALQWVAQRTRPDVTFEAAAAAAVQNGKVTVGQLRDLNKVVRRLKYGAAKRLAVPARMGRRRIVVATDASWAQQEGHASQGGYCVWIAEDADSGGEGVRSALVAWRSWKLRQG